MCCFNLSLACSNYHAAFCFRVLIFSNCSNHLLLRTSSIVQDGVFLKSIFHIQCLHNKKKVFYVSFPFSLPSCCVLSKNFLGCKIFSAPLTPPSLTTIRAHYYTTISAFTVCFCICLQCVFSAFTCVCQTFSVCLQCVFWNFLNLFQFIFFTF